MTAEAGAGRGAPAPMKETARRKTFLIMFFILLAAAKAVAGMTAAGEGPDR